MDYNGTMSKEILIGAMPFGISFFYTYIKYIKGMGGNHYDRRNFESGK